MNNILVIKLGALGDFLYAAGPMKAIRDHHKNDRLILLTRKPYADLARKTGFFDEIIIDPKPKLNPLTWLKFKKILNDKNFTRVYDLQNNDRTSAYFKLFSPRPEWSGIAKDASHRNADPDREKFHSFLGHRNTLKLAGIDSVPLDNLEWLKTDHEKFQLPRPYALIVPGSSAGHTEKRWPVSSYRLLSQKLIERNIHPVLIGSQSEIELCGVIAQGLNVTDLTGRTDFSDIVTLAKNAACAFGNDTGPMHMISMTGCKSILFYNTSESTIQKHGPQHENSRALESNDLSAITVEKVLTCLERF